MVTIPPIKMVMAGGWFMTSHAFNQSNMRLAFSLTADLPRWRLIWWSQQCDMLFFFTVVCPKHGHLSGIMINPLSTSAKNEKTAAKTGAAQNLSAATFTYLKSHWMCREFDYTTSISFLQVNVYCRFPLRGSRAGVGGTALTSTRFTPSRGRFWLSWTQVDQLHVTNP